MSLGRYGIPLCFISRITPLGRRPDTEMAYIPFVNRLIRCHLHTQLSSGHIAATRLEKKELEVKASIRQYGVELTHRNYYSCNRKCCLCCSSFVESLRNFHIRHIQTVRRSEKFGRKNCKSANTVKFLVILPSPTSKPSMHAIL
jgi:hypothetical protein